MKELKLTSRLKRALSFGRCYTSCAELPLYNFIKISVTNDLKYLALSGRPTREQLSDAWDQIFEEYATLVKSVHHGAYLSCLKEITSLKTKLIIIQQTVEKMFNHYNEGFAELLRSLGYRFEYDPANPEKYFSDLKLTISQSKSLTIRIAQREKDLEGLLSGKDITEADYEDLIGELGKFQGYPINPKTTSVSSFVSMLNRYKIVNNPKK